VIVSVARVVLVAPVVILASYVHAEQRRPSVAPVESVSLPVHLQRTAAAIPAATASQASLKSLLVGVPFADAGFPNGFRLSNLGGRREVYVSVPQGVNLKLAELVLAYDDISAHEARRSLEVLVNDRSVSSLALDGKTTGRTVRIPLAAAVVREGFLKLSFLYAGAATQDRCIDVRYVGDSITIRPESAVEFEIGVAGIPNIAATAALMPKDVAILLSNVTPSPADIAAALTFARSLTATGRHVTFHHGMETLPDLVERDDKSRWIRGLIVVGDFGRMANYLDAPVATLASANGSDAIGNALTATRIGGVPVLLVTDPASAHAGRLFESHSIAILRDTPTASIGPVSSPKRPTDRVRFDALGLVPPQAEVFGRADLLVTIPASTLPSGTKPSRLVLDLMVAPDGAGEKAVVSAFVNERLLASSIAAIGEPTRLDFALPDGLVGSVANIRTMIQRRSLQGDCRFEPQGYPAEILGSSSVVLSAAESTPHDFSDLATLWADGIEILLPSSTSAQPLSVVTALSDVLRALSTEAAPIVVKYVDNEIAPAPSAPFIAVTNLPPAGAEQRVRFDRGRVAVTGRAGATLLDVGGLTTGAVAQIVTSDRHPGLWMRSLSNDGSLPAPPAINLDHGDVAFLDKSGVALALSTERDTLLRVSYPEQGSWQTHLDRFRPWIVGSLWVLVSLALLFGLQTVYRRRHQQAGE
jgi:hypothetical protein